MVCILLSVLSHNRNDYFFLDKYAMQSHNNVSFLGQLSLWIGGSIISILQLLIYFFRGSLHYTARKLYKQKNTNCEKGITLANHNNSVTPNDTPRPSSQNSQDYVLEGESVIL